MNLPPGPGQRERLAFNAGSRADVGSTPTVGPFRTRAFEAAPPKPKPAAAAAASAPAAEPRDWAFLWTLIFTGVLFLRPQDIVPPLGVLHLAEISAVCGLVALILGRLRRRQPMTRTTPELIAVVLFGGIILATAPFSIWLGGSIGVFTDQYAKVILVYLLAVNVLDTPRRVERLTWLLVVSVGYIGFRAVWDYSHGANMIARGTRVSGSVGGLLQNPNDMALHMVVFIPFAVLFMLRESFTRRAVAALCMFGMIGAIVASGSRGGFLGLAAMLVVLALFVARDRPALVLAGVIGILCVLPVLPSGYYRRLASITDSSKDDFNSRGARQRVFGESVDAFLDNPITGVGAGNFKNWNPEQRAEAWHETHNVWLQAAAELGIFGLAVFTFIVGRAFYGVYQARRLLKRTRARKPDGPVPDLSPADAALLDAHSAAMAASLVGWFVCAFFASVAYNWTFYYLLALAVAPATMMRDRMPAARRVRTSQRGPVPEVVRA